MEIVVLFDAAHGFQVMRASWADYSDERCRQAARPACPGRQAAGHRAAIHLI